MPCLYRQESVKGTNETAYLKFGICKKVQNKSTKRQSELNTPQQNYSTVTDLAKLRGWSTSVPFSTAVK